MLKSLIFALFIFLTLPALAYAQEPITITLTTNQPGDIYLTPTEPTPSLLIVNNQVIYKQSLANQALDFKRLPNGLISWFDRTQNTYNLLDSNFQPVGQLEGVGYEADGHDIQLSPDGQRYLIMIYKDHVGIDMSQVVPGGQVSATVISCLIQEVDKDNNLVWEWDSFNHTPITHTNRNLLASNIDYDHCNSLAYDLDGNILISSRSLDSVTKVNRQTGEVMWRLGGVANNFTFTNDAGFALQHDARRLWNGQLTLFDNGKPARGYSRGVEYDINETTYLITRTWEYTGPFAFCCGNFQTLGNGNRLINWGAAGQVTEVTPDNVKVFELIISEGFTYRAFRFPELLRFPVIVK